MQAYSKLLNKIAPCIVFLLILYDAIPVYGQQVNLLSDHSSRPPAYEIVADTAAYVALPASYWQVMADPGGKLSLQQVLKSNHFQDTDRKVNYNYQAYWIRYRLVNKMPIEVRIAFPVTAAYAYLYTRTDSSGWRHFRTGTMVRWSKRDGLERIPAFTVVIPSGKEMEIYKGVYWNYVMAQPDSVAAYFASTDKLIQRDYVKNDSFFMTSLQDAFILGLYILTMIISFYFFLVVREKEFLYFSVWLLLAFLNAIPSLHDVFLREYPQFSFYLYIFSNSFMAFMLIHSLRYFLKVFKRFPVWDKVLVVFSFLQVIVLLSTYFVSSVFRTNLAAASHFSFNLSNLISGIIVLITLFLYLREHDRAIRLMIIAFAPILCLKTLVYVIYVIYHLYSPGFGEPALHGYVLSFNKAGFFILILCSLWMIGFFNWVLFLRFSNIRKAFAQQTELDHLKSRFFANISHEFRTPLTLIMGPIEDLLKEGDIDRFKNILPEIHRNSRRLLQLINQLLDLSKLDAGSYGVNTSREDIVPFIRQIVHSFSSLAERKNISLELKVDPDLSIALEIENTFFYFDEDIIEKIVTNLLSNAFKFTDEGGEIIISLGLSENKKDFLELKVKDSGLGIPAEKLPYIFDRFYQADNSGKRQYEGSGVGLALLKELIDLLQGKIFVQSEPGKGTTFFCYLPFNQKILSGKKHAGDRQIELPLPEIALEEEPPDTDIVETDQEKWRILLIEDHDDVRKYIMGKLVDIYTVMEARDGKEGLETAIKEIPDLIISDVMMPRMDGFELCERLKTDDRTSHIPVILLSARAEDRDKMTGLETGADAYLIKPFNSQELRIRVKKLIEIRNKMRAKFSDKLVVKPGDITVTSRDRQFMQDLLSTVESHISDSHFSVDQLAEKMDMTTSQIYRKLKALINQSAQQFIRSVRMQRALELLKKDTGGISEIAWKVGFEDPGYFSKVFKQQFGCLPSEKEKFPGEESSS